MYTICIVVLRKASSDRISLADETYSSSAFVSLQILIAFAPNPTYTFSAASATRGVCRFLSKQARRTRFEFIQDIRDLATKMHVTCPQTYLYTTVSCPYEGRARYTSLGICECMRPEYVCRYVLHACVYCIRMRFVEIDNLVHHRVCVCVCI